MSYTYERPFQTQEVDRLTDEAIIEMYFLRDECAIAESDAAYGAYCLAVANNILPSREDARECVNDTWLRAWNSIPPQRPSVLRLFFTKITRNLAYNKARENGAAKRGGELHAALDELEGVIGESCIERHIESSELTRIINEFLATLDVRERGVFVRRYFFVEATRDIAQRYAISNANVLTVLSRTRKKLRRHLEREGYTL